LAVIRQLDRPGIVTLRDANGQAAYALLTGLGPDSATLQVGEVAMNASLSALAQVWRGEFATLWRAPNAYRAPIGNGAPGPSADALSAQLAGWSGDAAPADGQRAAAGLKARVAAFQRAQGLEPDGVAGPATLMQLNRALGVDEPRLLRDAVAR
jgi:general secretion pathway protein A